MSFLKKLFGGKPATSPANDAGKNDVGKAVASAEHAGFTIHATPFQENGQWQLCGVVEKEIAGEMKSHRFIRADRFPDKQEAASFTLAKGRQIIDERGDALFG
ncbi:MAG: HlyU family transcriptional regulator [Bosea sp. (in: a-proteobacteria)]